jgi:2'-5' RNA ligase
MRLFIAVNIPDEIKEKISAFQQELRKLDCDIKWVNVENLHLTLKFIGEASPEKVDDIESSMKESVSDLKPFRVDFYGAGVFPDIHRPRVVWVGITEGADSLKGIASKLETLLEAVGIKKEEREFSAHATVGRVRSSRNTIALVKKLIEFEKAGPSGFGSFVVDKICLMQSILHPQGPEYKCLRSVTVS